MNNSHLYDFNSAGGVDYPETEQYSFDIWHSAPGLTDASEFKSIRFQMVQENLLLHWRYAYLEIHGQLKQKTPPAAFVDTSRIALIFNAVPHLFSNAKLTIGTRVVENINQVGHVSSMLYYLLYPRALAKNGGLQHMWVPDTDNTTAATNKGFEIRRKWVITEPGTKGKFKLRMPLSQIFGFAENFIALRGYPVEVELVRGQDFKALFRESTPTKEGVIQISNMVLNIPVVTPNNAVQLKLLQGLTHPKPYLYSFRCRNGLMAPVPKDAQTYQLTVTTDSFTERPVMMIVGFQETNKEDQTFNHALYSHQNVQTMHVKVNNVQIPNKPIASDFAENDNGFWYEYLLHMRANYLQFPGIYTDNTFMNPDNFKKLYPLFCFDLSKSHDLVSSRTVNTELHATFKSGVADHVKVYVTWFFDRTLELFSDGKQINIKTHNDSFH